MTPDPEVSVDHEPTNAHGRFGNWSREGIPHKGWICEGIEDVEQDFETCEMCETAEVRYVHTMTNPRWEGELRVGCICAGRMEEDATAAQLREKEYKRTQRNPDAASAKSWVKAADEILAAMMASEEVLTPKEYLFVRDIRGKMEWSARPRARKHYILSDKQQGWFVSIYKRVMKKAKPSCKT